MLRFVSVLLLSGVVSSCSSLISEAERIQKKFEDNNKPADCSATQSCSVPRSVGGNVTGLAGTVVLRNNGTDSLTITGNGVYTFATPIAAGATYNVTVFTQPAGQTCTVANGSGAIGASNITNVNGTCVNNFTLSGTATGLTIAITLQNNGGSNLSVSANGSFTFSAGVADGSTYNVTVLAQQAGQSCTVSNGSGTVSGANITNVSVTCVSVRTMTRLDIIQTSNWSLVQGYLQAEAAKGVTSDPNVYTIPGPAGTDRWHGGVLANNGRIYAAPGSQGTILEINPTTQATQQFGSFGATAFNYLGGVYAPNGKIYFIPHMATQVIELDPSSNTTRFVGPDLGNSGNKWVGGVLASNGKIYAIPRSSSSTILVIDTRSAGTLCTPVLESGYFNKY